MYKYLAHSDCYIENKFVEKGETVFFENKQIADYLEPLFEEETQEKSKAKPEAEKVKGK